MGIYAGDQIRLKALNVVDLNGSAITAPTATQLVVKDQDGNQLLSTTSGIVNDGGGNFHYDYTIPATPAPMAPETWTYEFTVTNGTYQKSEKSTFTVNPL